MRSWIFLCILISSISGFSQIRKPTGSDKVKSNKLTNEKVISTNSTKNSKNQIGALSKNDTLTGSKTDTIAPLHLYKIISYDFKETIVDTSLNIKKHHSFNYLRKDIFGFQQQSNDGHSFNVLDYSLVKNHSNPSFGFQSKSFNYYEIEDINYFKVPTAFTELSYRSAIKQGQNLNALFTTNLSEQLNLFVGYRGLRSLGSYINELSSNGNFKIGGSYDSKGNRYFLRSHIAVQDIMNQENGGVVNLDLFESSEDPYNSRERLNVYSRDGKSLFKGIRTFLEHKFKFNKSTENEIWLKHKFYYEYKTNQFEQNDLVTYESDIAYFGNSYKGSINDKVRFKNFYNKVGLAYKSNTLGELTFNVDHATFDYFYNSTVVSSSGTYIPSDMNYDLVTVGGAYEINKEKFLLNAEARQSISNVSLTEIKGMINFLPTSEIKVKAAYHFLSKIPDMTQQMFQSSYVNYNWLNNFSNEKIQSLTATVENPIVDVSGNFQVINDKIYFSNNVTNLDENGSPTQQLVTPKQYGKTIGYFNIKAQKEIKFGKFALDNTVMFQQVSQDENIVNVPSFLTRNTIYYTDRLFKKALFLQTGITLNYHTKYYGNEFNPIIGEYFVQNNKKIGGFPTFDFFLNAKIRTARVYLNLEHFNSSLTGYNFYATPTRPFHDMTLRFGIVWDFFN